MRDNSVTPSLPQQLLCPLPVFPPLFIMIQSPIPTPFSSPPFHLNSCLWARLGGTCRQKMLSEQQLSSSLFPRLCSDALSFSLSRAWFTSERQQKVSVLHLHVGLAFNKQNNSLTGRWEKASASVIWGDAPTFPLWTSFLVFNSLSLSSDSLIHRWWTWLWMTLSGTSYSSNLVSSSLREFLQILPKLPLRLTDELIRFWRSKERSLWTHVCPAKRASVS